MRLGSLPSLPFSAPLDINNRGQVVGAAADNTGDQLPFLWEDGRIRELPGLGGTGPGAPLPSTSSGKSRALPTRHASGFASHAFLWDGEIHDLGTLGGEQSGAVAINNLGQVVGSVGHCRWTLSCVPLGRPQDARPRHAWRCHERRQ